MAVKYYLSTDSSAPTLNGTAGSLITVLDACLVNGYGAKTALGWNKTYSGTNKAAYKPSDGSATGCLLRVDDSNAQYGLLRGYETMSDVDTGTNQFPTAAQFASVTCLKSSTADSTARPWIIVGDERMIYVFTANHASYTSSYGGFSFGDIVSYAAGDAYCCVLTASSTTTVSSMPGVNNVSWDTWLYSASPTISYPHHVARNMAGTGTADKFAKYSLAASSTGLMGYMQSAATYPATADSGVHIWPVLVSDSMSATNGAAMLRGVMPGIYVPWEYNAGTVGTTITIGSKTYLIVGVTDQSSNNVTQGRAYLDVTGPWR